MLSSWLAVFQPYFAAPTFQHVLVLVAGVVLTPDKCTVAHLLWVMSLAEQIGFARCRELLNPAR